MSLPEITIGFTDYYSPIDEYFTQLLSKAFNVHRNDAAPNYLFFCDETFGKNNLSYDESRVTKIFFTGENRRPWNYRAHKAISFDHLDGPNHYRLPLYVVEDWYMKSKLDLYSISKVERKPRDRENSFCTFISSNPNALERNEAFHYLTTYKNVLSGGPWLNNQGFVLPRGPDAQTYKIGFMMRSNFNLCYENSSYPGYVKEKLYHALYAGVIPIYWGSPTVELDFNPRAFVNRHEFTSVEKMLDRVKEIDHNDDLRKSILSEPVLGPHGLKVMDENRFLDWFMDNVYIGDSE
jgi:hypothetical protein